MIRRIAGLALLGLGLGAAGLIALSPIDPVTWQPPPPLADGQTCATAPRVTVRVLASDLPGKPDGLAFDGAGRLLVAMANGEVAAVDPASGAWTIAARGGGFLTGLADGLDGTIYAVDERTGALLAAPPGGAFRRMLDRVGSTRLSWTNDVTAMPDGSIAFTTTATGRSLDDFYHEVLEHRGSGLLVRYDPASGKARVLARGLAMTNGVAAMPDGNLLVAESAIYAVSLFSPEGERLAQLTGLPGFTGNIRASDRAGRYWVTLLSPRSPIVDGTAPYSAVRRLLAWLPAAMRPGPQPLPCVVEITREARSLTPRLLAIDGARTAFSTAIERDGRLYLSPASIAPGSTAAIYVADIAGR
ncbi:SMP-30/gluconolactonase/LRE family protein [Erythrobacter colymbi]|uniref:SMP-30/gluconolactonase/LRE family protein n=1 Tax=Erythrobacter colymbi TaxID=1161202 RepID=UPI000A37383F|nr:SMP-30/gluconolactonase/LRE family protein [Erythrobacter colymbi]